MHKQYNKHLIDTSKAEILTVLLKALSHEISMHINRNPNHPRKTKEVLILAIVNKLNPLLQIFFPQNLFIIIYHFISKLRTSGQGLGTFIQKFAINYVSNRNLQTNLSFTLHCYSSNQSKCFSTNRRTVYKTHYHVRATNESNVVSNRQYRYETSHHALNL